MGRPAGIAFEFREATVVRGDGGIALRDVTWAVRPGEAWAVVGPTASGKTTLLEAVQGKYRLAAGSRTLPAGTARLVAFKEESRTFSYAGHAYQQRYEFADTDEPLSLTDYLTARVTTDPEAAVAVAERFGLAAHLRQPFVTLSNGQTRRARLAKALLAAPDWLLLDDPFLGVDAAGRAELVDILGGLVAEGRGLILATAPEWVPPWVTHVADLRDGRVEASPVRPPGWRSPMPAERPAPDGPGTPDVAPPTPPVIQMTNVTVRHGGRVILDGLDWTVRAGERWAVLGPNGAGKTTLLALACGDHPQAFSNDVRLFGARRGGGETVWDLKRRIGFVSPEFHLCFREPLTAFEAAATAFGDSLLYRRPTPDQAAAVDRVFAAFGGAGLRDRKFARLSVGQQRLVLLVRAVVKDPPLLVLDEPFQGLDAATAARLRDWLDATLRSDQTLVFVTHVPAHLPNSVAHRLTLSGGRVDAPAGVTPPSPAPTAPSAPG